MKILQVVPRADSEENLKTLLNRKERELRGSTTAFRQKKPGRWVHVKYPGLVTWEQGRGGILIAEIQTRAGGHEWQLLQSFIGYLDRHLGDHIESISISYR